MGTSLATIEMAFDAADLKPDLKHEPPVSGQRRTLVEQYYSAIDWTRAGDVRKFIAVVESVLVEVDATIRSNPAVAKPAMADRARILAALENDGWEFDGRRFRLRAGRSHLADVSASAARLDAPELHHQLDRLRASVETDPALTLGTAKELVETACRTILEEHGRVVAADCDIGRLIKETRECLKLLPSDIPDSAKGAESIRRLLANLGAIVQGLSELRNLYGTGHGRSGKRRAIEPRHSKLAAGAAAALVTFLLETHWERSQH